MGFFDALFGQANPATRASRPPATRLPVEWRRAAELHAQYWTHSETEPRELGARPPASLRWKELLRLHHLRWLARVDNADGGEEGAVHDSAVGPLAPGSPFRARAAMVWHRREMRDDQFDERACRRGLDPAAIRRSVPAGRP